jgi:hypothetical protein
MPSLHDRLDARGRITLSIANALPEQLFQNNSATLFKGVNAHEKICTHLAGKFGHIQGRGLSNDANVWIHRAPAMWRLKTCIYSQKLNILDLEKSAMAWVLVSIGAMGVRHFYLRLLDSA